MSGELTERLVRAGRELVGSAAATTWQGPDPYDGLYYNWPRLVIAGARRRQIVVQLHARSPVDLRKLYRRGNHPMIAKALALFGEAALDLNALEPSATLLANGRWAHTLLAIDRRAGDGWGYPFGVQTRWSYYPADTPNVVVTSFAGCALGRAASELSDHTFSERASAAASWVLERCFDENHGTFSYHEHSDAVIHNANLLGARLVWRQLREDATAADAVRRAVGRTLDAQRPDGTWAYGEGPGLGWNDSFHTGFNLNCLLELDDCTPGVADAIARGANAYSDLFFGRGGESQLWPRKRFPEDAHAAGTGLSTLARLSRRGLVDLELLRRVAERVVTATVIDGHAIWRRNRWTERAVPYIRWCDAHVARGCADAATVLACTPLEVR